VSVRLTYVLDLFNGPQDEQLSKRSLQSLLECLTQIDVFYLQAHPETPLLYESGVRYMEQYGCIPAVEEATGTCVRGIYEDWQDVPTTLKKQTGDCKCLSAWRAAELRVRYGVAATATYKFEAKQDSSGAVKYLFHIQVQLPRGKKTMRSFYDQKSGLWIEDPSRVLGMEG
jgi:hypothetical protein